MEWVEVLWNGVEWELVKLRGQVLNSSGQVDFRTNALHCFLQWAAVCGA